MENRRVSRTAVQRVESLGFTQVHAYQPASLFQDNGRKLNRVAEPGDPWLMFATASGKCYRHVGADPMEAANGIISAVIFPEFGALSAEIVKLTETIRAG